MKTIDLSTLAPTVAELVSLAGEQNLVLETADGRRFVLAEIDDFDEELAATRKNKALMRLLKERSDEPAEFTLEQMRDELKAKSKRGKR